MDGWGGLVAMIIIQAMRDCEGKGRWLDFDPKTKRYQKLAMTWEATRWLRYSPQCKGLQAALNWEAYTGEDLIARAKSGEMNWRTVGLVRRRFAIG